MIKFKNTLHKSISKIYTVAVTTTNDVEEMKEVRKSLNYIIRWCIKHGADLPK